MKCKFFYYIDKSIYLRSHLSLLQPEGRRVRKTLTLALDPEAKTSSGSLDQIVLSNTKLIQSKDTFF